MKILARHVLTTESCFFIIMSDCWVRRCSRGTIIFLLKRNPSMKCEPFFVKGQRSIVSSKHYSYKNLKNVKSQGWLVRVIAFPFPRGNTYFVFKINPVILLNVWLCLSLTWRNSSKFPISYNVLKKRKNYVDLYMCVCNIFKKYIKTFVEIFHTQRLIYNIKKYI